MNSNRSAVQYFKERPAYRRAFDAMRRKWETYGRAAGNIVLENPTREERSLLGGFLGTDFYDGPLSFKMGQFENALKETKFSEISLKELLEDYFGEKLIVRKEKARIKKEKKEYFFQTLHEEAKRRWEEEGPAGRWTYALAFLQEGGYRLVEKEYTRDYKNARQQTEFVCAALEWLNIHDGVRLAVLGTEITRNPHAFDRNTFAGKLLLNALMFVQDKKECSRAEDIFMLYYTAGIKPDDISSFTTACGIYLYRNGMEHPAYKEFRMMREPCVITLASLTNIERADAVWKRVYLVENQMVFSQLCEELNGQEAAVICTSGQIKTASWILLDLLVKEGCQLFYCGDFDPEGLLIAEKVLARYPEHAKLWCMETEDYIYALSNEEISEKRLCELEKIKSPALEAVKREVLDKKRAGYQERLLEKMKKEILEQNYKNTYIPYVIHRTFDFSDKEPV